MSVVSFSVGKADVSLPAKVYHTLIAVHNYLPSFSFLVSVGSKSNLVRYAFSCEDYNDDEGESGSESCSESQDDARNADDGSVVEEEGGVVVLEVGDTVQEFDYDEFWTAACSKKVKETNKSKWNKFELVDLDSKVCISHCTKSTIINGNVEKKRSIWLEVVNDHDESLLTIDLKSQPISNFMNNKFGIEFSPVLMEVVKLFVY